MNIKAVSPVASVGTAMTQPNSNEMKARMTISLMVMILFGPVVPLYEDEIRVPFPDWVKKDNKAGSTATPVACGWAGAILEVTRPFGQEQCGQRIKIMK